jgi:hypothetical protein
LYGHIIIACKHNATAAHPQTPAKNMELLQLHQSGPIARIVINHPARKNAFSRAMWRTLPSLVAAATSEPQTRLLTLEGVQTSASSSTPTSPLAKAPWHPARFKLRSTRWRTALCLWWR